jgi:hypothetical protein
MTLSALEGVLGALFRAPHPAPRLEGGTLCCEGVFVYRVGHLPHGLAYNLFGSCLGFLSGTHLSTSTLTVRVPLSVGENPEQAVSRLPTQCLRRSAAPEALSSYPCASLVRCRGAPTAAAQAPPFRGSPARAAADCRRASPDARAASAHPRRRTRPKPSSWPSARGRPGSSSRFAECDLPSILHQQGEPDQVVSIRHGETHSLQLDISAWSGFTTV